jgi:beta-glucanase (GH16 family)
MLALAGLLVLAAARWVERDSHRPVTEVTTTVPAIAATQDSDWKLAWSDEFDGSSLDTSKWRIESSRFGQATNTLQCYSPDNVSVRDGHLDLEARRESKECPNVVQDYTSGMVRGNLPVGFGAVEIRARMPKGAGFLPALWMLPVQKLYGSDGRSGEIDIAEVNTTKPSFAHGTVHWRYPDCGWGCSRYGGQLRVEDPDPTEGFHTYRMEWGPGRIAWYVDGVGYYELGDDATHRWASDAEHPDPASAPYPQPFTADNRMYLLMNLAVGGDWAGSPTSATPFPAHLLVDYVRVYEPKDGVDR